MKYISIIFISLVLSSCAPPIESGNTNKNNNQPIETQSTIKFQVGVDYQKVCIEGVLYYYGVGFLEPVPYVETFEYVDLDKGNSCND